MIQHVGAFLADLLILSFLTAALEYLIPAGRMKSAAQSGLGLMYTALLMDKIMGIFEGMGV